MNTLINEINNRLYELLEDIKPGAVKDAMYYALSNGGKRIRPVIFLTVIESYSHDYHPYIDIACAIEMIHTYSLIHDDLPGMDDDDLRRGKPSCHIQFDEATAILAGDALLNHAINVVANTKLDDTLKVKLIQQLFKASGANGMIYGQQQDLYFENVPATLEQLNDIHRNKTGKMIAVAFQLAALIVANKIDYELWTNIGFDLGLAFQIQDDILDVVSDSETLGKPVGSDSENHKSTYVTLLGIDKSNDMIETLFDQCYKNISKLNINDTFILQIIKKIQSREK